MAIARRQRARRGSGSITPRGQRFFARVDLGVDADGMTPSEKFAEAVAITR